MSKCYYNNGIIGNSKILACISDRGELLRLFWPNIDYLQHVDKFLTGIFVPNKEKSTQWLTDNCWSRTQHYIDDTNILKTIYKKNDSSLLISGIDYVLPTQDVLIREYEIQNNTSKNIDLGFISYSSHITNEQNVRGTLFDFSTDSLIHYIRGYYISTSTNYDVLEFQVGNNAHDSSQNSKLSGIENFGMVKDGAISYNLGTFLPNEKKKISLSICFSNNLNHLKNIIYSTKKINFDIEYENTLTYWHNYLKNLTSINSKNKKINTLYNRSLLLFKLMSDSESGAIMAAPEVDEQFSISGGYGYCWIRDAAFITIALDSCGLTTMVDTFFQWAKKAQDLDGFWHQRYFTNGSLAPSWGIQIDETGTLIWSILQHYRITKNKSFLKDMLPSIEKGIEFLINYTDKETMLPKPSHDLWEERLGEHAYSSSAVYSGVISSIEIFKILKKPKSKYLHLIDYSKKLKESILKNFYKSSENRFIRSIRTKINPWGEEPSQDIVTLEVNTKGVTRDFTLEDYTIDVSLLGLCIPFSVFDINDKKIISTVSAIESNLTSPNVGGIKRYEGDNYIGGNPWILTTLWVALYYIEKKDFKKATEYLHWTLNGTTNLGLLPEQINKENGNPIWVFSLTWSHAMFVLVITKLKEAGQL